MTRTNQRGRAKQPRKAEFCQQRQRSRSRERQEEDPTPAAFSRLTRSRRSTLVSNAAAAVAAATSSNSSSSQTSVHSQKSTQSGNGTTTSTSTMYHVEVSSIATGMRMEAVDVTHSFFASKTAAIAYAYEQAKKAFVVYRKGEESDEQEQAKIYDVNPATDELLISNEGKYFFPAPDYTEWGNRILTKQIALDHTKEMLAQFAYSADTYKNYM